MKDENIQDAFVLISVTPLGVSGMVPSLLHWGRFGLMRGKVREVVNEIDYSKDESIQSDAFNTDLLVISIFTPVKDCNKIKVIQVWREIVGKVLDRAIFVEL